MFICHMIEGLVFEALDPFLGKYKEEQKKDIITERAKDIKKNRTINTAKMMIWIFLNCQDLKLKEAIKRYNRLELK